MTTYEIASGNYPPIDLKNNNPRNSNNEHSIDDNLKDKKISQLRAKLYDLKQREKDYDSLNQRYKQLQNDYSILNEAKLRLEYEIRQRESEYNRRITDLKGENEDSIVQPAPLAEDEDLIAHAAPVAPLPVEPVVEHEATDPAVEQQIDELLQEVQEEQDNSQEIETPITKEEVEEKKEEVKNEVVVEPTIETEVTSQVEPTEDVLEWDPRLTEDQILEALSRDIYEPVGDEYEQYANDNSLENDLSLNILKFLNINYNDLYYKLFNLNNIILFSISYRFARYNARKINIAFQFPPRQICAHKNISNSNNIRAMILLIYSLRRFGYEGYRYCSENRRFGQGCHP